MSMLFASLDHTGRRLALGHTYNTLTFLIADEFKKRLQNNLSLFQEFVLGHIHSTPSWGAGWTCLMDILGGRTSLPSGGGPPTGTLPAGSQASTLSVGPAVSGCWGVWWHPLAAWPHLSGNDLVNQKSRWGQYAAFRSHRRGWQEILGQDSKHVLFWTPASSSEEGVRCNQLAPEG